MENLKSIEVNNVKIELVKEGDIFKVTERKLGELFRSVEYLNADRFFTEYLKRTTKPCQTIKKR